MFHSNYELRSIFLLNHSNVLRLASG